MLKPEEESIHARQKESFVEEIRHREGDLVMVPLLVDWIHCVIFKGVIHPAKIPLIVKS